MHWAGTEAVKIIESVAVPDVEDRLRGSTTRQRECKISLQLRGNLT